MTANETRVKKALVVLNKVLGLGKADALGLADVREARGHKGYMALILADYRKFKVEV